MVVVGGPAVIRSTTRPSGVTMMPVNFGRSILAKAAAFGVLAGVAQVAWCQSAAPTAGLMTGYARLPHPLSLSELNDVFELQQVMAFYSRAVDRADAVGLACLYSIDGEAEIDWNDNGTIRPSSGRLDRQAMYEISLGTHRPPSIWNQHALGDPIIELHGDRAVVGYRMLKTAGNVAEQGPPRAASNRGIAVDARGYYQFEFKRVAGAWKIAMAQIILDHAVGHRSPPSAPAPKLVCPQ